MKKEIEQKFLVRSDEYKLLAKEKLYIRQAYLDFCPSLTVRVRIKDGKGFLTLKNKSKDGGLSRDEWEREIPVAEAEELINKMAKGYVVEKWRYRVPWNGKIIEVDEFLSPRKALVLAEIEWDSLDEARQKHDLPAWLGEEVTGRPEYYNAYMAQYG